MKKIVYCLLTLIVAVSCAKSPGFGSYNYTFSGKLSNTKMMVGTPDDGKYPCLWSAGDKISIISNTDYRSLGDATLQTGAGENHGSFSGTLDAEPGTVVRVAYPAGEFLAGGTLETNQVQKGAGCSDISKYALAFSSPVTLIEGHPVSFSLTQVASIVKVRYSFQNLGAGYTLKSVKLTNAQGEPVSGDYQVNFDTGKMTPSSTGTQNYVNLTFEEDVPASTQTNEVWLTTLPDETGHNYMLTLNMESNGNPCHVDLKFGGAKLLPGRVNTFNATSISGDSIASGAAGEFDVNDLDLQYDPVEPKDLECYTYPKGALEESQAYGVTVEGEKVYTFNANPGGLAITPGGAHGGASVAKAGAHADEPHVAIFGAAKPVTVKVQFLKKTPSKVDVRPLSKNYTYTLSGNELTITLQEGDRISVEPDGDTDSPLFIFVNPVEVNALRDAMQDPQTKVYKAGTLTNVNTLQLRTYKKLYIQGGAIVKGCIFSKTEGINDVSICGCGIVDSRDFDSNSALTIYYSDGVEVRNLTVLNRKCWTFRMNLVSNFNIDNVKVVGVCPYNDNWDENDAIHFLGSKHGIVTRCFGYSWDDAFNIGTNFQDLYGDETFDIHVSDAIAWNVHPGNSFEFGWTCEYPNHDHSYKDCYAIHSGTKGSKNMRAGISFHNNGSQTMSNISYENIYIEDPQENGLYISTLHQGSSKGTTVGHVKNISFKNINILTTPPAGCTISGYSSSGKVEDITFDGLYVAGKKITSLEDPIFVKKKNYNNVIFK